MHIVCRKLIATYFTSALIGLFFGLIFTLDSPTERVINFYGMTLVVLFYGGLIILVYGNVTSLLSEFINKRWLRDHTLTFIAIHLIFGACFGMFFNYFQVSLLGMAGAVIYAFTDRVLYKQKEESRAAFMFLLSPPVVYLSGIVLFWIF